MDEEPEAKPGEAVAAPFSDDRRLTRRDLAARRQLPRSLGVDPGSILESITDAFFALDDGWCFVYVNAQAERLLGRPREALLGRSIWEEFPEAVDSVFWREYHRAVEEQETVTFDAEYPPLSAWFAVRAYPLPSGLAVYFEDITEKRAITRRVRELEERFRSVQEVSPDGFLLFEAVRDASGGIADFTFLYLNPAAEQFLALDPASTPGKSLIRELPHVVREGRFDSYRRVVETGEPWRREIRYERDGRTSVLRVTAIRVGDGLAVTFTDITDRVRAEEVVQASERRERFLAEVTRILASTLDFDRTVEAAARLTVPGIADLCIVDVYDDSGELRRLVVAHEDPRLERTLVKAVGVAPAERDRPTSAIVRAIDTRKPVFMRELPADVAEKVDDPGVRRLLEVIRPRELIAVPLLVHGEMLGVLQLVIGHRSGRQFHGDDVALAEEFARRAAGAIDNARHYRAALAARAEAEGANAAKSQFLATMSHELRTPLNAILGYTELLDIGVAGTLADPQRDYLNRVQHSGRHLLALINDILDLSKVEAGQMSVRQDPVRMIAAVEAAVAFVRPQATVRGLTLEEKVDCAPESCAIGDDARVRQIVTNLLANAVKFTEPGGRVELSCGVSPSGPGSRVGGTVPGGDRWAYVRVSDTGIGIPAPMLERIFEPFVQVDSGHTRTQGGTGLGLAISRRLARLMHGDLTVESTEGEGSAFTLWLPAEEERSAAKTRGPRLHAQERSATAVAGGGATDDASGSIRGQISALLKGQVREIVEEFTDRLRSDPTLPGARGASEQELEDHYAAFLMDVSQQLGLLGSQDPARATLIKDGSEIQEMVSELHGAQRLRLGFTEADIRCEYRILRDLLVGRLRSQLGREEGLDDELGLLCAFLDEAEAISLRGFRNTLYS